MTGEEPSGPRTAVGKLDPVRGGRYGLVAGALLMISALLQGAAAAQRWAFAGPETVLPDRAIEDHLYDYVIPADPWVSVGSAASLFGLSYLLIGAALVCLGVGGRAIGGRTTASRYGAVAAAPFALLGLHALVSGLWGIPSLLQHLVATYGGFFLGVIQVVALVVFAVFIASRALIWAVGVADPDRRDRVRYVWAMISVAPILVGYQSDDTTNGGMPAATTATAAVITG